VGGGKKQRERGGAVKGVIEVGGNSSILLYSNTFTLPYLFENILIYLEICGSICNFVAQKEKIDG
jgi:hypothetical protein